MCRLGHRAVVVGGSIAGLITVRVLSDYFDDVVILEGLAPTFFERAAELNSTPWNPAAGFDVAFPQTRGERPPGVQERARYFAALDRLQVDDREVQRLVAEVFHLLRPLSALQEEPLRSRALARM